jgi:hypothetical protein
MRLTNIDTTADGTVRPRLPLGMLGASIGYVRALPFAPNKHAWEGPTLSVKRAHSKCVGLVIRGERDQGGGGRARRFINLKHLPIARQLFSNMHLGTLDRGQWDHRLRALTQSSWAARSGNARGAPARIQAAAYLGKGLAWRGRTRVKLVASIALVWYSKSGTRAHVDRRSC